MFTINRSNIEKISKDLDAKKKAGKTNKIVFDTFKLSILNLIENIEDYLVYDMAHWINNVDRWIKNNSSRNTTKYKRGTIAILDLGSQNFRYEPSYSHPCVILVNKEDHILVVPCSSKKFGKGYSDVIDADKTNGFSSNTGVQIESYRWVNKNRVISVVGNVDNLLLNKIDDWILQTIPSHKLEISKLQSEIEELKRKLCEANNSTSENDRQE